jgi:hypothetical protein
VHMHMVLAYDSLEYPHVFRVTDLHDQVSTPHFDFTLQHMVSVLCYPHDVGCQSRDAVAIVAILLHSHIF